MFTRFRQLNIGGIFGGVVCAGGAAAIIYLLSRGVPVRSFKLIALAALGGSALGNWIWRLASPLEQPAE